MTIHTPKVCLHITSADAVESILKDGLLAQVGPLSTELGEEAGVFLFPSWEALDGASWLFDDWPYDSEPALLCVDVSGLELESDVGYELVSRANIPVSRITLLAPGEEGWDAVKPKFVELGGLLSHDTVAPAVEVTEDAAALPSPPARRGIKM